MSALTVRPFRRDDRDQLTALVNAHVAAVVPGVSVSTNTVPRICCATGPTRRSASPTGTSVRSTGFSAIRRPPSGRTPTPPPTC